MVGTIQTYGGTALGMSEEVSKLRISTLHYLISRFLFTARRYHIVCLLFVKWEKARDPHRGAPKPVFSDENVRHLYVISISSATQKRLSHFTSATA